MKSKKTKPVKPEIEFLTCMRVDDGLFYEGDIVTVKYSRDDDILTATGRIAFIGGGSYGLTLPYIRLDCSSEWHSESICIEGVDILECKFYRNEVAEYCINDVAAIKAAIEAYNKEAE